MPGERKDAILIAQHQRDSWLSATRQWKLALKMQMRQMVAVFLFLFLASSLPVRAQHYSFKNYAEDQGLTNLSVSVMLED